MTMRPWAIPAVLTLLLVVGAACGGSSDETGNSGTTSEPQSEQPTATPIPTPTAIPTPVPTSTPEPTATPIPSPTPEPEEVEPTATPESETEEEETSTAPESDSTEEAPEADDLRELGEAYWKALNDYEIDKVLGLLEDSYRQAQEETLRGNVDLMKTFEVKLTVTEESGPQVVDDETREMYWLMKSPLSVDTIHMIFKHVGGEWKIASSERLEEGP